VNAGSSVSPAFLQISYGFLTQINREAAYTIMVTIPLCEGTDIPGGRMQAWIGFHFPRVVAGIELDAGLAKALQEGYNLQVTRLFGIEESHASLYLSV
jgi:hypothetical protein